MVTHRNSSKQTGETRSARQGRRHTATEQFPPPTVPFAYSCCCLAYRLLSFPHLRFPFPFAVAMAVEPLLATRAQRGFILTGADPPHRRWQLDTNHICSDNPSVMSAFIMYVGR